MQLSPAERQRRSDLAKRLHREGKFGGRQPARRSAEVRARRASEIAAQVVERHRDKIEKAILAGLNSKSVSEQLKAADLALKMGFRAETLDVSEHRTHFEHADRQQLLETLAAKLTVGPGAGMLRRHIAERAEVIDAEVIELPAER